MDKLTKGQRSELMSRIKSAGTGPEKALESILKKLAIPHVTQPTDLPGNPDLVVGHVAVFVHGCFFHKCPEHFRLPKTRSEHWAAHIGKNVARHRKNARRLRSLGFRVAVIWEHDLPRKKKGKALEAK